MKAWLKSVLMRLAVGCLMLAPILVSFVVAGPVFAACDPTTRTDENGRNCTPIETSILPPEWAESPPDGDITKSGMFKILKLVLNILVYGLGVAASFGVVWAGVSYMTSRGDPQQMARTKMRLFEMVIGFVAWAIAWVVLDWLLPGGMGDWF